MAGLDQALAETIRLAVDTAPWIYFVEGHPKFAPVVREVISRAETTDLQLVTSTLTLTEVMTHPFRHRHEKLIEAYRKILLRNTHLDVIDLDVGVAEQAARLRAEHESLKTPDAI